MSTKSALKLSIIALALCFLGFLSLRNATADSSGDSKKDKKAAAAAASQAKPAPRLFNMTQQQADANSVGCLDCHTGIEDMHSGAITIGCTDCHGGDASVRLSNPSLIESSGEYQDAEKKAHVQPRFPESWKSSANPERPNTLTIRESPEFIRFVNPGDLRIAHLSCGTSGCHTEDTHKVKKSMMTTGALLWGAALYNNGSYIYKNYRFGETFNEEGVQTRVYSYPLPKPGETKRRGVLEFLDPLPRWEASQMGNILRTFERGGKKAAEIGNPIPDEAPGKPPQNTLSNRGLGTLLRTDPVFLGLQKTRLLDPMNSMFGTNDHPGDYRSSGCTSCHVVYANDSDWFHSGPYDKFGHTGLSGSKDKIFQNPARKQERGHPIEHKFTRAIPSSNCVVCHMHPGTLVLNSYYGSMWWDLETDGSDMYDPKERSPEEENEIRKRNPEESSLRGKWADPRFLETVGTLNKTRKNVHFNDYAGHGWVMRSVFKRDRKGNLLDEDNNIVTATGAELERAVEEKDPEKRKGLPVHMKDIHIELGMHCVDCHFKQDSHGNGKLYGDVRAAVEIECKDCHGSVTERADPLSSKATTSATGGGNRMIDYRNLPSRKDRFFKKIENGRQQLYQRAAVATDDKGKPLVWRVKQVMDTIDPQSPDYNEKAALAKTIRRDNKTWGVLPESGKELAHTDKEMSCYTCHTSWTPSCFGCHLKMQANEQRPMLHNEGEKSLRNWTTYNFQTLRDDVFLLGKDGTSTGAIYDKNGAGDKKKGDFVYDNSIKDDPDAKQVGRRYMPVRSACAIYVSSQNALREWLYFQQQSVSQEGYSGHSFSPHFPHTVRTKETRKCDDCHLSKDKDNNAYLAMTYMQGTNMYNFIGRYAFVALGEEGFAGVVVTERREPQAVIGSYLHKIAYPEEYKHFEEAGKQLHEFYEHPGNDVSTNFKPFVRSKSDIRGLQLRGEYLYAACGEAGFKLFDVANIDQKGFSERMTSAPFSPMGQKLYMKSKNATAIASPATIAVDPTRNHRPENEEWENRDDKQGAHLVYAFLYGTDSEEGLVVIGNTPGRKGNLPNENNNAGVATLLDGDPNNNFIQRQPGWNPDGKLTGANNIVVAGTYAYITADKGLFIVDLDNPMNPRLVGEIGEPFIKKPRAVQVQFRYAFVCDAEGVKVIDITNPKSARPVSRAVVPLTDARSLYLVRTYAYVAAGKQGLAIIDIENPENPKLDQIYNAGGEIDDAYDVKTGMTNASLYAYIAGGHKGLQIVQLICPDETPGHFGFSPRPTPRLIASHHFHVGGAYAVSEGIDRDRAVDEAGYQLSVFGRRGARPMNSDEMRRMMYTQNGAGEMLMVPKITDNDRKKNRDIRGTYGDPVQPQNAGSEKGGEPTKGEQQSLLQLMKRGRLADILGFSLLFGAIVLRLSRKRLPFRK